MTLHLNWSSAENWDAVRALITQAFPGQARVGANFADVDVTDYAAARLRITSSGLSIENERQESYGPSLRVRESDQVTLPRSLLRSLVSAAEVYINEHDPKMRVDLAAAKRLLDGR